MIIRKILTILIIMVLFPTINYNDISPESRTFNNLDPASFREYDSRTDDSILNVHSHSFFIEHQAGGSYSSNSYITTTSFGSMQFFDSTVFYSDAISTLFDTRSSSIDQLSRSRPNPTSEIPFNDNHSPSSTLRIEFDGSNTVSPIGDDPVSMTCNRYLGMDPDGWLVGGTSYKRIIYPDIYNGIDLVYYFIGSEIKYEFFIKPGGDPNLIRVHLYGHDGLKINMDGDLCISWNGQDIIDKGIDTYYLDQPDEKIICGFEIISQEIYGFTLAEYDLEETIVIDPLIMSSLVGGSVFDISYDVTTDPYGNIILSGITRSTDLPINESRPTSHNGATDKIVMKFSHDGRTLLWTTYIGGSGNDEGEGLSVTDNGDIFICGETASTDFPITSGAVQKSNMGSNDLFLARLNGTNGALTFSTYIGGDDFDYADDLVLDEDENPILCGKTDSTNFPVTTGALQESHGGSGDGYVLRLSSDGSTILHSTFLGDRYADRFYGIAIDASGFIYLTGLSQSRDFPTTNDAYQSAYAGGNEDVIICKLDSNMSTLVYSTFLGAGFGNTERGKSIKVYSDGSFLIMGETNDERFPTTASAFQRTYGGGPLDVFLTKFSSDGSSLAYSSYLGGGNLDMSNRFTIDSLDNAYVVGVTRSVDFPLSDGAIKTSIEGEEAFLCRIGPSGNNLNYSTLFGGSGDDYGYGIAHIEGGSVIITGASDSADFPLLGGYNQTSIIGSVDMFFTQVETDVVRPHANAGVDEMVDQFELFTFKGDGSYDDIRIVNFTWSFDYEGNQVVLNGSRPTFTFDVPGIYSVTLRVIDRAGNSDNDTVNITVLDVVNPNADAGPDLVIDQHETAVLNGTASSDLVGIVNYSWEFSYGDQIASLSGRVVTFRFDLAGQFVVVLTVTDKAGNSASDTVNVTVNDITPPIADAGQNMTIDQGTEVLLDGRASSDNVGVVNWTWKFEYDSAPTEVYGDVHEFTYSIPGLYEISLIVRDQAGLFSDDTVYIRVLDIYSPLANTGGNKIINQFEEVLLDGSASSDNVGIINWTWEIEIGATVHVLHGPSSSITIDMAGQFDGTLTVWDAEGNSGSDTFHITVRDMTPPIVVGIEDIITSQHEEVTFDATSCDDNVGIANWTWSFSYDGDDYFYRDELATHRFDRAGMYTVTLVIRDYNGNENGTVLTVLVEDTEKPEVMIVGPEKAEVDDHVTLDGSGSIDNIGVVRWEWTFSYKNGEERINGSVMEFNFHKAGEYTVTLSVWDDAGNMAVGNHSVVISEVTPSTSWNLYGLIIIILVVVIILGVVLYSRNKE